MDKEIESLIKECPQTLRGRTGELTREERERFDNLNATNLRNKVLNASPGFAAQVKWIDPVKGEVLYEDDQRRTLSLEQLGYRLIEVDEQKTWVINRPEVIRAHKQAKNCY
jgi:hypothetical protein